MFVCVIAQVYLCVHKHRCICVHVYERMHYILTYSFVILNHIGAFSAMISVFWFAQMHCLTLAGHLTHSSEGKCIGNIIKNHE